MICAWNWSHQFVMRLQRRSIEIITRGAPHSPLHHLWGVCVQSRGRRDTLSHCDTFHFTVVWFENKYENSFHLPAKKEFHWVSLLFSHFSSLPYLSIFMRVSCLAMSHRVVLSRVTDHVQLRHLGLTVCSVVHAKIRPRSWQARERQKIIRIYVDDYCIECISIISAVI